MPANQIQFDGGLNAQGAWDKIAPNEIAQGYNIDFSLVEGAITSRRGSRRYTTINGGPVRMIWRSYSNPNDLGNSPWYFLSGGNVYRANGQVAPTLIASNTDSYLFAFGQHRDYTLFGNGSPSSCFKDDGTNTTEWISQAPAAQPSVSINTLTPLSVGVVWTIQEGTGVTGTNTATASTTGAGRVEFRMTPTSTNLTVNGTNTLDDTALDSVSLMVSDPSRVLRVSRDYSIGDATFSSYYHTELKPADSSENTMSVEDAVNALKTLTLEQAEQLVNDTQVSLPSTFSRLSYAANVFNVWSVTRGNMELVNNSSSNAGWANIGAIRVIIEVTDVVVATVTKHEIAGADSYPLTDADVGYVWWETWATLDSSGTILDESASSGMSARLKMSNARAVLVSSNTPTGSQHGFTHRMFYRQGGYMKDGYCVGSCTLAVSTFTDTVGDLAALTNNIRLTRNMYARNTVFGNITSISEPYFDRTFVSYDNKLAWSEIGKPGMFKYTSVTDVGPKGDNVMAVVQWMPSLVVLNRDSVYEFSGRVFDGAQSDWSLYRTGCRRGTKAPLTAIRTPYGIPILDYDGLHMYVPGQGVETPLQWVMDKIGDAWRGEGSNDPATLSGGRVPPINKGYIRSSFCVYANNKLYLGVPTNSATLPNVMFVIDMAKQRVWWYTYPFFMTCGWWDGVDNALFVGTHDGCVMQIETNNTDSSTSGSEVPIVWQAKSRMWSWPNEVRLTNVDIDNQGACVVNAIANTNLAVSTATRTNLTREHYMPTMSGGLGNSLYFDINGTNTLNTQRQIIYGIGWDAYEEPPKVLYHRTEYKGGDSEVEFLNVVSELDCLGGTVTGTMFVEGNPRGTFTYTGSVGPQGGLIKALPQRTFGWVSYLEYRSTTPFRHYNTTFATQPEPPRVTYWRTEYFNYEGEQEWLALANQLDCLGGSVVANVYVDSVLTYTGTFTGSGPQGYVRALPQTPILGALNHPYGRSAYVIYTSITPFKHYNSWFEHRPEPSRVTHYRVPTKIFDEEQEIRNCKWELNCLGGSVAGTLCIDGLPVNTFTATGSGYVGGVVAMPSTMYGRSVYVIYNSASVFKHYSTEYDTTPEPPRVTRYRVPTKSYPTEQIAKTWVAVLNPLGTCTGTLFTKSGTVEFVFIGTQRETFNVGLDVYPSLLPIEPDGSIDVTYTSTSTFKHYDTDYIVQPTPSFKNTWYIPYTKVGGASQLDLARFWSMDVENPSDLTVIATSVWLVDEIPITTQTWTIPPGRAWKDRQSFPPGARGYNFTQRMRVSGGVKVWASNIDTQRTGVKGFGRLGWKGDTT